MRAKVVRCDVAECTAEKILGEESESAVGWLRIDVSLRKDRKTHRQGYCDFCPEHGAEKLRALGVADDVFIDRKIV